MEKRTTRFLKTSIVLVLLFCAAVFAVQTVCMNLMGENTIRQLGVFYMSGMSEQVASHFGTTIELRLSQVESLVNSVPPGRVTDDTSMRVALTYNARSAGFEYLALYMDDGSFRMIYGSQITADVPEALRRSVQGGKYNVCAGKDRAGVPVVLLGVPANYSLSDGTTSVALVAGLPTEYLKDTLERNIQSDRMEYSIIRDDGSYVLHNSGAEQANYFDRVEQLYEPCGGKEPSQYAEELRGALEADADYTSEVMISGERWNLYCTKLPNSEWHLIFKISHNTLDETVNLLQMKWSFAALCGGGLIICALLSVFAGYYRLTIKQLRELELARRTAEQAQLSAEQSSRAKSEFLSNMSHDIRTPMNGIMGMTSIAISSMDDPPRVRSCLKRIHVSSRHLLGLINDMLDMSKLESGELTLHIEPLSLRELAQNLSAIIQPQVQEKNQRFHFYVHEIRHENVCTDRVRLNQIFLNIVGNAVKFTPEGGDITVDLYEEPSPKGDEYIRSHLHVRDNGIGMSKEFQGRIFDAFTREDSARVEKAAGAGMGMTITKRIVDAMDGVIEVESEQGAGSHFHVILDLEKTMHQEKELCLPERNVLVVTGDARTGELAADALESVGLRAGTAADMEQAFRMLEEQRDKNAAYHIVLLDREPDDQDGFANAHELALRFGPELSVILLTDGDWDESEDRAAGTDVRGFIPKPLFRSGLYYGLRPFMEPKAACREPEKGADPSPGILGRRILLAEDNELNWEIADELLSETGMEVDWAENGRICVEKFEASPVGWYDAILMDMRMPVMTGLEAAIAIRRLDREDARTVPIIAVSADAFAEDIQKCLDSGMNAHTAKPFNLQEVLSLLERYLP
ncbi:MAG: response regulator [Muribaculaceae bacterium]|nr:response regulator [Muribaculaceae bacterium]